MAWYSGRIPTALIGGAVALFATAHLLQVRTIDAIPSPAGCVLQAAAPDEAAAALEVTSPAAGWRASTPLTVSGNVHRFDLGASVHVALRDAAGGTLAESFSDPEPGAGDRAGFHTALPFVVAEETPACLWVSVVPPSMAPVPGPLLGALLPVMLLPAAGPPATMGRATPYFQGNTGAALLAAAKAYVGARSNVPVVDARIVRVVRNWAAVRLFPPPGVTDPATVILHRPDPFAEPEAGAGWTGVTYGTAGLCEDEATPPILCEYGLPYAGGAARFALATIEASEGRAAYAGRGFHFDYPADGRVFESPFDPFMVRVQRFLPAGTGFVYDIEIQPALAGAGTVDQWGYTRMVAETSDLATCPLTGTYFETESSAVFQVDCAAGSALERRFYLTAKGAEGGVAALVRVTIPAEGVNPWQPEADTALTLLLNTFRSE